jgi:serine/threonine-protein kinase HipA
MRLLHKGPVFSFCPGEGHDLLLREGSMPHDRDALAARFTRARSLYRRMVFNVLISNVDDHLRNYGFLWLGRTGWSLSPAYDLNPTQRI